MFRIFKKILRNCRFSKHTAKFAKRSEFFLYGNKMAANFAQVSPVAGNESFSTVATHAAQIPNINAGTVDARQVDALFLGQGGLGGTSGTLGDEHTIVVSGNPILMGNCCYEEARAQITINQDSPPYIVGDNGGSITIGSDAPSPAPAGTSGSKIGFFGATPISKPNVSLGTVSAAVLLDVLDQLGLVTQTP